MSGGLGTAQLLALAGLGFAALVSLETALFWPALERRLAAMHPARAAWGAWAAAAAPVGIAGLALGLCLAPGLLGVLGGGDHCLAHGEHPHLCLVHPVGGLGTAGAVGLGLAVGSLALGAGLAAARLGRAQRLLRALARLPRVGAAAPSRGAEGPARAGAPPDRGSLPGIDALLAIDAPLAATAGWWRPRVVVSRGLASALDREALAAVVAHERAHARRRDALRELVAHGLAFAHLPGTRRRILATLRTTAERACDEEAAARLGDRLAVAEALLRVGRVGRQRALEVPGAALGAAGFDRGSIGARVAALLDEPPSAPGRALPFALAAAGAAVAWLGAAPLHHAAEHLLARLLVVL